MRLALGLALALGAASARAQGPREALEGLMRSASQRLELRLGRMDDPSLEEAALQALSRGAKVRLILDDNDSAGRPAAALLRRAGCQLRWAPADGARYALADGRLLGLGDFDGSAWGLDGPQACVDLFDDAALAAGYAGAFEAGWKALSERTERERALEDELGALPDPRDNEPHWRSKRRDNLKNP